MILSKFDPGCADGQHVCIVGAGPVGLSLALQLIKYGLRVLLLEGGSSHPRNDNAAFGDFRIVDTSVHGSSKAVSRQGMGGTSSVWGGECSALDALEFEDRPHVFHGRLAVKYSDLEKFHAASCDYFGFQETSFHGAPLAESQTVRSDEFIRVCPTIDLSKHHHDTLRNSKLLTICLNSRVLKLGYDPSHQTLDHLEITSDGSHFTVRPPITVLCCGGIQTTRLLLISQREEPALFGGKNGPLGRYYMGHLSGTIARINFNSSQFARSFLFRQTEPESHSRRIFSIQPEIQKKEHLLNSYFGVSNFPIADPAYKSGALSLLHLGLVARHGTVNYMANYRPAHSLSEFDYGLNFRKHAGNVISNPLVTAAGLARIGGWLAMRGKKPNFGFYNKQGIYALRYHAEQFPNYDSRVTLSDQNDDYGSPLPKIDYRFTGQDFASILKSHSILAEWLLAANIGRLNWHTPPEMRIDHIKSQASDGFHQIGLTRISENGKDGIVDENLAVHGIRNLFIAGTSILPVSGKCHPTFPAVIFAMKLAEHIARNFNHMII